MKKEFFKSAIFALGAAMVLTACSSSDDAGQTAPDGITVSAKFAEATEAGWNHTLFLFKGNALVKSSTNKAEAFRVEAGQSYTLKALVIENKANITLPASLTGVNDEITVKNVNADIPQMLFGSSASTRINQSQALGISTERLVSKLNFTLNAPSKVTGVQVEINGLNDKVNLEGVGSASKAGLKKKITLIKEGGAYKGAVILLPSQASKFDFRYTITLESGNIVNKTIAAAPAGGGAILVAGEESSVSGTITVSGDNPNPSDVNIAANITYGTWVGGEIINSGLTITTPDVEPDPEPEIQYPIVKADKNAMEYEATNSGKLTDLIDGDYSTTWKGNSWSWPKSITIDLGTSRYINKVTLARESKTFFYFQVIVTENSPVYALKDAIPADNAPGNIGFTDDSNTMTISNDRFKDGIKTGRYVTIQMNKHSNGWENLCNLSEIQVF